MAERKKQLLPEEDSKFEESGEENPEDNEETLEEDEKANPINSQVEQLERKRLELDGLEPIESMLAREYPGSRLFVLVHRGRKEKG